MKLSNTLGAATLALGLATAGCSNDKVETGELSAEKAADMQKQAASASAAPSAAPAPQVINNYYNTPNPAAQPAAANGLSKEDLKALDAFCEPKDAEGNPVPKSGQEHLVVDGTKVYLLCTDGHDKVMKVLDHGKETNESAHVKKASEKEDGQGNTYYDLTMTWQDHCKDGNNVVLHGMVNANAKNQTFFGHPLFKGLGVDSTKLPFSPSALLVPVSADTTPCDKVVAKTTPKTHVQPVQPKTPAQPKGPSEHDKKQDEAIAQLGRRIDANDAETAALKGQVGKLKDWAVTVKPSEDKPDLNAAAREAAQKK
ncbi:hypothetical protein KC725_05000 [Candidatus Peregrinibacteria bacterium]|nr:hypothetical protein [Candidatus Peregrinibacteria bacterium]